MGLDTFGDGFDAFTAKGLAGLSEPGEFVNALLFVQCRGGKGVGPFVNGIGVDLSADQGSEK